jgi:phospholipase/carboxylesterase
MEMIKMLQLDKTISPHHGQKVIYEGSNIEDADSAMIMLHGRGTDFHIPEERVDESARIFESLNAKVTKRIYPEMGHTINRDEVNFINQALSEQKVLMVSANR